MKKRPGRKGVHRELVPPERVDHHVQCLLSHCPHCGSSDLKQKDAVEILQQAELPESRAFVTEYSIQKFHCRACKKNCTANLPEGVPNSSFGPKMTAFAATLTGSYLLPKRDAIRLIKDLYEVDIGLGSISNMEERVAKALTPVSERTHNFILKRHYAWIACNQSASILKIYRSRSGESFEKLVKGNTNFSAVTDRYAVYNKVKGDRQYCLAHLIRDFQKYAERDGPD